LDRRHRVFGAHLHRYQCTAVSDSEITTCEQQLGCALPEEFRRFLMEVGHCAGPYYGVWGLQPSVQWLQHLAAELATEEKIEIKPSQPFPLIGEDLRDIERKVREQSQHPWSGAKYPNHGSVPICHQGCLFWSVFVLRGNSRARCGMCATRPGIAVSGIPPVGRRARCLCGIRHGKTCRRCHVHRLLSSGIATGLSGA
jgi:hypothetical protein